GTGRTRRCRRSRRRAAASRRRPPWWPSTRRYASPGGWTCGWPFSLSCALSGDALPNAPEHAPTANAGATLSAAMMRPAELPFDARAMLAGLRTWVECESPTFDAAAVNRMLALAAQDLAALGARIETIPGRMGFGNCVRARLPHSKGEGPGILILGHFDTVHPVGTLAQLPWREADGRCYGPGTLDMKGGNYMAVEALRQLARAHIEPPLPVTYLLTSDEEVGSPSTRELIEAEAKTHRYVLVPEPGRASGGVVT